MIIYQHDTDVIHSRASWVRRGSSGITAHNSVVVADAEAGIVDSIHVGGLGGHFQNVAVQFPNATHTRGVSMTVTGWRGEDRQQARSFTLENMLLDSGDSIRAQITDGGRELMVENHGPAKTLTLRLSVGFKAETVTMRTRSLCRRNQSSSGLGGSSRSAASCDLGGDGLPGGPECVGCESRA